MLYYIALSIDVGASRRVFNAHVDWIKRGAQFPSQSTQVDSSNQPNKA